MQRRRNPPPSRNKTKEEKEKKKLFEERKSLQQCLQQTIVKIRKMLDYEPMIFPLQHESDQTWKPTWEEDIEKMKQTLQNALSMIRKEA